MFRRLLPGMLLLTAIAALIFVALSPNRPPHARKNSVTNSGGPEQPSTDSKNVPLADLPDCNRAAGFVSAKACRICHEEQFESWHGTFHRTMTQKASPESVIPSFDNVVLTGRGRHYQLYREGDEFWVDTIDPAAEMKAYISGSLASPESLPRVRRRIVMTTGSHRHQTYWMQNSNGTLVQFPWVYHVDTKRWVYRIDSFLSPPRDTVTFNIWNMKCLGCHATGGQPRMDPVTKSMHSVGELGISCEACHGPGREHVKLAEQKVSDLSGSTAHPRKMSAEESARICGQCHVIARQKDEQHFLTYGDPYHPGNNFYDNLREVVLFGEDTEVRQDHFPTMVKTGFWPDGTVRTGGREYNGLLRSDCYSQGSGDRQMTCISCHSMHNYESPNKLMARGKTGDQQCVQCHQEKKFTTNLAEHTHHPLGSEGSRCINCHMPHTSYALFRAIRSHRVQSPAVRSGQPGGRPNACNLCHLDQTKAWTAEHLLTWYGLETPPIGGDEARLSAAAIWALKGDAAQRAIMAWHFGWQPALEASGSDWLIPLLSDLLRDSYSAVRYIAYETLRRHSRFENLEYDFDGAVSERERIADEVLRRWMSIADATWLSRGTSASQLLLRDGRTRDAESVKRLLKQQDDTPISIVE